MSICTQERDIADAEYLPFVVHLQPAVNMSDDQFFEFCQVNRELRIERNEYGDLIIMPPAGSETGNRNLEIAV
jgi:Uma2 family endonuclease